MSYYWRIAAILPQRIPMIENHLLGATIVARKAENGIAPIIVNIATMDDKGSFHHRSCICFIHKSPIYIRRYDNWYLLIITV